MQFQPKVFPLDGGKQIERLQWLHELNQSGMQPQITNTKKQIETNKLKIG